MKTRQQKIRKSIITFFKKRKRFTTAELLTFVQKSIDTEFIMPDTIMRVMRQLRQDSVIGYDCPCPRQMAYFVTKKP